MCFGVYYLCDDVSSLVNFLLFTVCVWVGGGGGRGSHDNTHLIPLTYPPNPLNPPLQYAIFK